MNGVPRAGLVAIDIDGTLTGRDGTVSPRTATALARLRDARIPVVLATGRPWKVAEQLITTAGGADFVICSNGAMTVQLPGAQVLRNMILDPETAPRVVRALRDRLPGVGFALELEDGMVAEVGFLRRLVPGVVLDPEVDDVMAALTGAVAVRKVLAFHDDYDDDVPGFVEIVRRVIGAELLVSHSGLSFVEVGSAVSKMVALAEICDLLAIEPEQVVAFGDDVNDIEMLRWAGTGVAVGNAVGEVKAVADLVVGSNLDEGVAAFLEQMLPAGAGRTGG